MTQEEAVYDFYLKSTTKSRDEAIQLLKDREFFRLNRGFIHWFDKKAKIVKLKSTLISEVAKELSKVKFKENETEPKLSCHVLSDEDEAEIEMVSYIYTIVPLEKCESLAKHYAKSSLWKLEHQPNGKDAEHCRNILKKYNF